MTRLYAEHCGAPMRSERALDRDNFLSAEQALEVRSGRSHRNHPRRTGPLRLIVAALIAPRQDGRLGRCCAESFSSSLPIGGQSRRAG